MTPLVVSLLWTTTRVTEKNHCVNFFSSIFCDATTDGISLAPSRRSATARTHRSLIEIRGSFAADDPTETG
jgi:hypothetical protein